MDDYAQRAAAIEGQSAPLREQARAEYRKLKDVTEEVSERHNQAQLAKDELEFRHEVGELTDDEVEEKLNGPLGNNVIYGPFWNMNTWWCTDGEC